MEGVTPMTQTHESDSPRAVWFFPTNFDPPFECQCGEPLVLREIEAGYCPGCDKEFVGALMSVVRFWQKARVMQTLEVRR